MDELPTAYAVVKTLNAAFMSLAAIPAYLLARRMLAPPLSLVAAVLTVAVPSMVYTGTVMTENVFYPLFLTAGLALVLVLEKPTLARQIGLFVLVGLCFATRAQAVAFIPAILLAPLLLVVLAGRPVRDLIRFRTLYALVGAGTVVVVAAQAVRGRSLSDLLGAYSIVGDKSYDPETVARYFLYHLAELDLYLGVLPFAAFLLLVLVARRLDPPVVPFLAAGIALSVSVLLVVAAFASVFANRIQERNTFVVAPFFLIALLVWLDRGLLRPRGRAVGAAAVAVLLPLTIPWGRFIETGAISDTLALLPIWSAFGSLLHDSIDLTVLAGGAVAAALFLFVPRRYALALPLATLLYFAVVSNNVWFGEHGFKQASAGALFSGIRTGDRDWIDDAVPKGTKVAVVWTGVTDRFVVNQNEFFNRSVGPIYYVGGATPGGLAETEVHVDEGDGSIRLADGSALDVPYVLLESTISPDGSVVTRDPAIGVTLWRLDEPLVSTKTEITGLYPNDTWSGPTVTYVRRNCHGGILSVRLSSDPMLFESRQTIVARVGGRVVSGVRLEPDGMATIRVRLRPRGGDCRVVFHVSPTKMPKDDPRVLGAHFNDFFVSR